MAATPNGQLPSLLLTTSEPLCAMGAGLGGRRGGRPTAAGRGDRGAVGEPVAGGSLGAARSPSPRPRPTSRAPSRARGCRRSCGGDRRHGSDTKIRNLPYAVEEGRAIAMAYAGLPLTVSEGDVDRLMNGALERDGAAYSPTVVHFASHGQVSTAQQQYTGILLSGAGGWTC